MEGDRSFAEYVMVGDPLADQGFTVGVYEKGEVVEPALALVRASSNFLAERGDCSVAPWGDGYLLHITIDEDRSIEEECKDLTQAWLLYRRLRIL